MKPSATLRKQPSPIWGAGPVKVTDLSDPAHLKQSASICSTRGGTTTSVSAAQSMKLDEPMNCSVSGSVTVVSAGMLVSAASSSTAMGSGIVTEVIPSLRANSWRSTPNTGLPSTSAGTTTSPPSPE